MRVVVHEPTLSADGEGRVGAVVLAAVRAEVRRLEETGTGSRQPDGGGVADGGPDGGGVADGGAVDGGAADGAAGVTPR